MHVGAAQILGADHLAGGGLHQRGAGQEDGALVAHDDALVAHRRDVGAAGGAGAHHHGDLGMPAADMLRLVVEDAAEMVAVGEHLVLVRQVGAAAVHQVDAGQPVLQRDLLRAEVLLHGQREVGAALHRGVVGDDHALAPGDAADAGDRCRRTGPRCHTSRARRAGPTSRNGGGRVEQRADAVARQQLAAGEVALAGRLPAALPRGGGDLAQVGDQGGHGGSVGEQFARGSNWFRGRHRTYSPRIDRGEGPLPPGAGCLRGPRDAEGVSAIMPTRRTARGRSACGGSRWCRRRSRTAWRRAAAGRSGSR